MADLFGKETREYLDAFLANHQGWITTDQVVQALDDRGAWDAAFLASAIGEAKKALVRKLLRQLHDETGSRKVASVMTRNPEGGETERVYKQESLFDVEDYRQVCRYHAARHEHHYREARRYAERCKVRFGVDPMPPVG